jgi:hypothetical protein
VATTFVVEDGTGLSTANSYASLAFADQYVEDHLPDDFATWDAQADADKQANLRGGARYLDRTYATRYAGSRTNEDQALAFPQEGIEDFDGFLVDSASIPVAMAQASVEAGIRDMNGTDLMPDETTPGDTESELLKVGPITISEKYAGGGQSDQPTFPTIDRILQRAGLILPPGRVMRS